MSSPCAGSGCLSFVNLSHRPCMPRRCTNSCPRCCRVSLASTFVGTLSRTTTGHCGTWPLSWWPQSAAGTAGWVLRAGMAVRSAHTDADVVWMRSYGELYPTLRGRVAKTLHDAFVDVKKPLTTQYGAVVGTHQLCARACHTLFHCATRRPDMLRARPCACGPCACDVVRHCCARHARV